MKNFGNKTANGNKYGDVCICAFRVLNGETFFKDGKTQLVQDKNMLSAVKGVVKNYMYYYDNYPTDFFCSAGVFFVCVDLCDGISDYDALLFLTRLVYQVQKYLLKNLHLVASGCIIKGKRYLSDKTKICLNSIKVAVDFKTCSAVVQPYIMVDDVSFLNEAKLLEQTNHLFKAGDNFYIINYFRFLKDVESMQFVVDYMGEIKNEKSKQVLLFKEMFDKAGAKLKEKLENNYLI